MSLENRAKRVRRETDYEWIGGARRTLCALQQKEVRMNVERSLRLIAGAIVLATLSLGYWVSPYWYIFTAFVGLNLFQSAFTNWCPMMTILRKLGVPNS